MMEGAEWPFPSVWNWKNKKQEKQGNAMKKILGAAFCGMLMVIGSAEADTLKVDKSRSRIQVDAKATGHEFTGTLEDYTVKVSGDGASLKPSSFELEWKFADLKTGDEKRDKEMVKWLGGGGPTGSFKFTKTWDDGGKHHAQGTITIHGISKVIAFPYTVTKEGNWVTIDGTARLDYEDFALSIIRSMAVMTVDPKLSVRFHVVGKL
jgi:polyisoprenoid-binding protein YceI